MVAIMVESAMSQLVSVASVGAKTYSGVMWVGADVVQRYPKEGPQTAGTMIISGVRKRLNLNLEAIWSDCVFGIPDDHFGAASPKTKLRADVVFVFLTHSEFSDCVQTMDGQTREEKYKAFSVNGRAFRHGPTESIGARPVSECIFEAAYELAQKHGLGAWVH